MDSDGAELAAAKTAIRRQHGCDSYYVGSHTRPEVSDASVVHEFVLDDTASTAYVWFVKAEPRIVLKVIGSTSAPPGLDLVV